MSPNWCWFYTMSCFCCHFLFVRAMKTKGTLRGIDVPLRFNVRPNNCYWNTVIADQIGYMFVPILTVFPSKNKTNARTNCVLGGLSCKLLWTAFNLLDKMVTMSILPACGRGQLWPTQDEQVAWICNSFVLAVLTFIIIFLINKMNRLKSRLWQRVLKLCKLVQFPFFCHQRRNLKK